ncbi:hypothetical protein BT63DRAFT_438362 [Microthyrium microscopicum]|uniref:Rad21/Rec8-like protein N-terminal domain-containing protein n=1 Tax=Microthyrium microscopicum TaxID=703497 RepID=A0A6A6UEP6_9PEZI|nr:hypothetical protein BT63DRAFT_438362 [Microthyrium microscopicum]
MFYSDVLLAKTGPLATVWLAANMERKLSKKDFLASNLESTVEFMMNGSNAPMALRLSGHLLLGTVKVYSKQARYLLDDVNDVLIKLKVFLRRGNIDRTADLHNNADPASLQLEGEIYTQTDFLAPFPDLALTLDSGLDLGPQSVTINWGTQSIVTDTIDQGRSEKAQWYEDAVEGLDLGDGFDDTSLLDMEKGRDQIDRAWDDEETGEGSKLLDPVEGLDLGDSYDDDLPLDLGGDVDMTDLPGLGHDMGEELGEEIHGLAQRARDSESPLSDISATEERELEKTFAGKDLSLYEPQEEDIVRVAPKLKRRKVLEMDSTLELRNAQIKEQQSDRSRILKPASFLPRDPMLLALLSLQKSGGFVSNILGDGRSFGWAPELREILSVDMARRAGTLKRKRDSGVADMYSDEEHRLQVPEDDTTLPAITPFDDSVRDPSHIDEMLPADEDMPMMPDDAHTPMGDNTFDDTTYPLLHPADAGPISQGTRHAVHVLRDVFPEAAATNNSVRAKSSVLLQDLIPERRTTRRQATAMFFEVLVLATKDAVKVEQRGSEIGGPIRLRAKRGLWGEWAEQHARGTQSERVVEEVAVEGAEES